MLLHACRVVCLPPCNSHATASLCLDGCILYCWPTRAYLTSGSHLNGWPSKDRHRSTHRGTFGFSEGTVALSVHSWLQVPIPDHMDIYHLHQEAEPSDRTALQAVVDHIEAEVARLNALEEHIMMEYGPEDERLQVRLLLVFLCVLG